MARWTLGLCMFSALALSACTVATEEGGDEGSDESQDMDIAPDGKGVGVFNQAAIPETNASIGISYHGGPVMTGTNNKIYYIWYGDWTGNTATSILTDFANNLGGSPWWNIQTTYTNGSGVPVSTVIGYGGSTTDAYSKGKSLSDTAIWTIVKNAISAGKLPKDANGIYLVLTSQDVTATSGFCTQYCGWHTYGTLNTTKIKYSFVGNAARCINSCAYQSVGPNGNAGADGMASIVAHEIAEAVSDPQLNAWYDSSGWENADKCAWTFGTTYNVNGAKANMQLGSRHFLIQRNWVATTGTCATGL